MSQDSQQLIRNAQNGDLEAFRQLVESYQQFVYNVAFRFTASHEDARDVVQECFIRVWKNLHKFDARKKMTTWLYKIIINLCYDELRRAYKKYRCDSNEQQTSFENLQHAEDVDDMLTKADLAEKIKNLSGHLKPRQRTVFILRDLEDLDMEEIAKILKISISAVKSNLYYARQNIRKKCQQLGYIS
ncbi:RNA polymerase sigma factor [candidate division KSB1 bacterium]|nr:RNA polymerase sigma factor [candidate division KSB1 bacterium]